MLLILLAVLLPSAAAHYDAFEFNVTLLCSHQMQYEFSASFNIRDENPNRPIENDEIASFSNIGLPGITHFSTHGIFKYSLSASPVYEVLMKVAHNCVSRSRRGVKVLYVHLPTSPQKRSRSLCSYRIIQDVTDKSGDFDNNSLFKCE